VAAIGVAQEFQRVWAAYQRDTKTAAPQYTFAKADRRVTCYYFYLWDEDFGPTFIKVCAYFPYPAKVWVNGHEWAKRQALRAGIAFTELSNGFGSCEDPAALQAICDRLQPGTIEVFAQRWLHRLPMPFGGKDQKAGYWWELSMRQVEVSRTIVFDAPRRARPFFEALIGDNLDIGRPSTWRSSSPAASAATPRAPSVRPAIGPDAGGVVLNVFYKHSRVKQYLKDGRAMRIETVINGPRGLRCNARLPNLAELQDKARAVNRRILDAERAGQGTVLASPAFERIAHPSMTADGRRTPALRFGDPRVMALCLRCGEWLGAPGRDRRPPYRGDDAAQIPERTEGRRAGGGAQFRSAGHRHPALCPLGGAAAAQRRVAADPDRDRVLGRPGPGHHIPRAEVPSLVRRHRTRNGGDKPVTGL
jgi:hypothetical protein